MGEHGGSVYSGLALEWPEEKGVKTQIGVYCSQPDRSDSLSNRPNREQYPLTGSRPLPD